MMNTVKHNESIKQLIEKQFGENYDAELVDEVSKHLDACPDCKVYINSVHETIELYRETENKTELSESATRRLIKVLKLEDFKK